MQLIKTVLLTLLTVFSLSTTAFANDAPAKADSTHKAERFNDSKKLLLERADREINMIQQFKSCLIAAQDKAAADTCRKNKMDAMQQFHKDNQEAREDMHEKAQEMREEKREAKRNSK